MTETTESDVNCDVLAADLRANVDIEDRRYKLKTYSDCFIGSEAVDWLVESGRAHDRPQAVAMGNLLVEAGYLHHVLRDHEFADEHLFYRFTSDEEHGRKVRFLGRTVSWEDLIPGGGSGASRGLNPQINVDRDIGSTGSVTEIGVAPLDEHNIRLLDAVHPPSWVNPQPDGRYNMVVIGGGTGGLVTAAAVAGVGGKVALIEEHMLGGDCLNFGCVPSKALLRCARAVADVRNSAAFGVRIDGEVTVDFPAVMERLRRIRSEIAPHDSAERFAGLGVDVFVGRGTFTGEGRVSIGGRELTFARACIATGGQPAVPPIEGLDEVDYRTNLDIFNLEALPSRLGIVGAGAIGCEMAQAFARFGSEVTLFEIGDRILPREDADAAAVVQAQLKSDGVEFEFGASVDRVGPGPEGSIVIWSGEVVSEVDELLIAVGRKPNVDGLGLDTVGVEFDRRMGVKVDDRLQTTNSDIYAVGDVATKYKFTHAADFMARQVVRNALFFGRGSFSDLLIPWCTYTEPAIAHVGLYPSDLDEREIEYDTFTRPFAEVDRAKLDDATEGFVRVHTRKGSDEIVGATIVGRHAGDLIGEMTLAMQAGMGLSAIADVIHPYPTMADAIRQVGDMYNRTRLTPTSKTLLRSVLSIRR